MSGWNRQFVQRSSQVLIVSFCSLYLPSQGGAQVTPGSGQQSPATAASPRLLANPNLKLGVGDLIEVSVFGVPDLATKTRISGSGDIYLP